MANMEVDFCGVRIKNPVVAASAEPTLNARNMKKCIDTGAGGVIAKTMTDSPAMRELTTRAKWRFLNERHEVCRGRVPRARILTHPFRPSPSNHPGFRHSLRQV